ncbi:MAG: FeoC-like transcriptional regulator [Maritimibacter sp.]
MTLSDLRSYLQTHKRAALFDMALHFDSDPDTLRPMLAKWISKGKVVKLPAGTACSKSCRQCDPATIELYEWQG